LINYEEKNSKQNIFTKKYENIFYQLLNRRINLNNLGSLCFYLGTLFLPSALPISSIFYIFSLLVCFIKKSFKFDKYSLALMLCSGLMIFVNIRYFFYQPNPLLLNQRISQSNLDLFNWIPFFLCFIAFQTYLKTSNQRKEFIKYLLIGTVPVIASCIGQYWFKWYGQISTLNGLVIWFQKNPDPYNQGINHASGLFSNPNYAGFWLATTWPFAFVFIKLIRKNLFPTIFFIFNTYFLIFTNSRNAILAILLSSLIIFKPKAKNYFLILLVPLIIIILNSFLINFFNLDLGFSNIIPINLIEKITKFDLVNLPNNSRVIIFRRAFDLIRLSPLIGLGASTYSTMSYTTGDFLVQHTHNISLELALNYGLPVSILLTAFVSTIVFRSSILIFNSKDEGNLNKAWLGSVFTFIIFNLTDIVYYDGKLGLISWILLAGLKAIMDETIRNENQ
tara:strand:- start:1011 stop:2357 length:1347 start_codon:yes stop_codon:yes gene_type:complete